jgi:hypothetical protein
MQLSEEQFPVDRDEGRVELHNDQPTTVDVTKHGPVSRAFAAVICGVVAGMLISGALANGCMVYFSEERYSGAAWLFLWGEHWAIRVLASWASAIGAGFIAGMVARQRGQIWAGIAALPSTLCWLAIAAIGWMQKVPFFPDRFEVETSIGNKLAASLLVITIIPLACYGGRAGEEISIDVGEHFDSRRFTLLGIKWYHYLWLPILILLQVNQAVWAFLYGFEWLRNTWRVGPSLISIVPWIFTLAIWWTLSIMFDGAVKCYRVLSGLEKIQSARSRAFQILKYGIGFPLLAAIIQTVVSLMHYGLVKLFTHGQTPVGG